MTSLPALRIFVKADKKQATLTGRENRSALPFLPFAVVGLGGATGVDHRILTTAVADFAALTKGLFADCCLGGGTGLTLDEAELLAIRAQRWALDLYQPVLGPSHTTKLHKLAAHVFDEFRLRGNMHDGNTSYNEQLHKLVKLAYRLTNHKRTDFLEQLLLVEQVTELLTQERQSELDAAGDLNATGDQQRPRPRRIRRRGRRTTLGALASSRRLSGLVDAVGLPASTILLVRNSTFLGDAAMSSHGRADFTVRAAPELWGRAWYDWVRYRDATGAIVIGRAEAVLANASGTWERLVVSRSQTVDPEPGGVLSSYGCQRLKWSVRPGARATTLDDIPVSAIVGLVSVEYDWEDLCTRHGHRVMPTEVRKTYEETTAQRFFTNAFDPRTRGRDHE